MSLPAGETEKTRSTRHRQKFEGHTDIVLGVIHLRDGQRIMTCSDDGSLRVWNLESGKQIGDDWRDGESGVFTIALSPDGKKIVSGSRDGWVRFWDIDTGKVIIRWMAHIDIISSLCWSRDGRRVVTGSCDKTVRVWNVESRETILEIDTGLSIEEGPVAIYSADETMIATSGQFLKIWGSKTGKLIKNLKERAVASLAWTIDGSTLISASQHDSISTWNTTTWQQIYVLTGHTSVVEAIAISPNGRILASGSQDKTARLWNLDNGQPIGLPIRHADRVFCVSFSADGKLLASGCGQTDNSTCTWDISAILREAGLDELLLNLNDGGKPLLDAQATRRPRLENAHRVPPGFFDDSPHHRSSRSHQPPQSSAGGSHHAPGRTFFGRASSLFQRTAPGPRALDWVRTHFSGTLHRRNDEDTELHARRPVIVDVPFTKGKRRNISAAEIRLEREKAKKKKKKKPSAGSSQPHQSIVTQQSGGAVQAQPGLVPTSTPLTTPTVAETSAATMSTTSRPDVMITQPGCWTRFWLFTCCASTQYTDGHH